MVMWRYTYTYVCISCACTCTTQVLPHISILCFAHPHFPIGARCTRESQHALPRLKNKLGYLCAHADVIFCHMHAHMTWCTCACTYVLHAHVCAQIQHFLTFQNFASHVHISDRCTLQLPAGVTACVAMLPRLNNKRVRIWVELAINPEKLCHPVTFELRGIIRNGSYWETLVGLKEGTQC